jgi:hypothetical protein
MDDLQTKLTQLENSQMIDYVMARSEVTSDKQGYENAGVSKPTFYGWGKEKREYLNELARDLKVATGLKARLLLSGATERAAEIKIKGLESRKEHIQQSVSTEILDRMLGKPTQKNETEQSGEIILRIVRDNDRI